jgi:putative Mg2+ transporter-C (MgtC) family protein
MNISIHQFEFRLLIALAFGAVIGIERQWRHKTAGVKTNALVALGAALFVLMSERISGDNSSAARVAAQIVTGIGFLGAGAIMRDQNGITGLNTAATVWCSGAIGCLTGLGFIYEALVGSVFVVGANIVLKAVEKKVKERINPE